MSKHTFRNRSGALVEISQVTATEAKNAFGRVLDRVASGGAVAITRHDKPRAVLLDYEEFESLRRERSQTLEELGARFDGLLERMQTRTAREGMEAAFGAPPEELGRSAVEQARKRREG